MQTSAHTQCALRLTCPAGSLPAMVFLKIGSHCAPFKCRCLFPQHALVCKLSLLSCSFCSISVYAASSATSAAKASTLSNSLTDCSLGTSGRLHNLVAPRPTQQPLGTPRACCCPCRSTRGSCQRYRSGRCSRRRPRSRTRYSACRPRQRARRLHPKLQLTDALDDRLVDAAGLLVVTVPVVEPIGPCEPSPLTTVLSFNLVLCSSLPELSRAVSRLNARPKTVSTACLTSFHGHVVTPSTLRISTI
mmetsp:Transcript_21238/g.55177  ORF Transcript_21238/g.55177 Transcript_21238/m.55177 type:complete len:247 (-) Transcript_21238:683-1423(-)